MLPTEVCSEVTKILEISSKEGEEQEKRNPFGVMKCSYEMTVQMLFKLITNVKLHTLTQKSQCYSVLYHISVEHCKATMLELLMLESQALLKVHG